MNSIMYLASQLYWTLYFAGEPDPNKTTTAPAGGDLPGGDCTVTNAAKPIIQWGLGNVLAIAWWAALAIAVVGFIAMLLSENNRRRGGIAFAAALVYLLAGTSILEGALAKAPKPC